MELGEPLFCLRWVCPRCGLFHLWRLSILPGERRRVLLAGVKRAAGYRCGYCAALWSGGEVSWSWQPQNLVAMAFLREMAR